MLFESCVLFIGVPAGMSFELRGGACNLTISNLSGGAQVRCCPHLHKKRQSVSGMATIAVSNCVNVTYCSHHQGSRPHSETSILPLNQKNMENPVSFERAKQMSEIWSAETITDPTYRAKFIDVPNVIASWLEGHGGLEGRDILDFGCGEATMALGIALRFRPRRIVGVEIHKEIDNCVPYARAQLKLEKLPKNLELIRIAADMSLESIGTFDVIYSWSVFEHVSQNLIVGCLTRMKRVLRQDGVMFLQTTPLYYSANGSHFMPWLGVPWAHLTMQHDRFFSSLREKVESAEEFAGLREMYESLNRITAEQLLRAVRLAGFEIIRDYRTYDEVEIPDDLKKIYAEDVLRTNQLVLLTKHAQ